MHMRDAPVRNDVRCCVLDRNDVRCCVLDCDDVNNNCPKRITLTSCVILSYKCRDFGFDTFCVQAHNGTLGYCS